MKILSITICYGKTMKSIAEDLRVSEDKAQEIYDAVMTNIPGLKRFMEETENKARELGYVETKWGRRRHLPDMQLEPYVITSAGAKSFDPFFDSEELGIKDETEEIIEDFKRQLMEAKWYKQKMKIKEEIKKAEFNLVENTKRIADATRQCVNSVVQGSAADQSKIALRLIGEHKEMKRMKWKTMLLVHDEIIGECPLQYAKSCMKNLVDNMLASANDLRTGAACDPSCVYRWYGEEIDLDEITDVKMY